MHSHDVAQRHAHASFHPCLPAGNTSLSTAHALTGPHAYLSSLPHLAAIQTVGDVVVAIRIQKTVNLFAEVCVALFDAGVPPLLRRAALGHGTHFRRVQRKVATGPTEHHAVCNDCVRALEVVNDTLRVRDASVTNHRDEPRERRKRLPYDCARISGKKNKQREYYQQPPSHTGREMAAGSRGTGSAGSQPWLHRSSQSPLLRPASCTARPCAPASTCGLSRQGTYQDTNESHEPMN